MPENNKSLLDSTPFSATADPNYYKNATDMFTVYKLRDFNAAYSTLSRDINELQKYKLGEYMNTNSFATAKSLSENVIYNTDKALKGLESIRNDLGDDLYNTYKNDLTKISEINTKLSNYLSSAEPLYTMSTSKEDFDANVQFGKFANQYQGLNYGQYKMLRQGLDKKIQTGGNETPTLLQQKQINYLDSMMANTMTSNDAAAEIKSLNQSKKEYDDIIHHTSDAIQNKIDNNQLPRTIFSILQPDENGKYQISDNSFFDSLSEENKKLINKYIDAGNKSAELQNQINSFENTKSDLQIGELSDKINNEEYGYVKKLGNFSKNSRVDFNVDDSLYLAINFFDQYDEDTYENRLAYNQKIANVRGNWDFGFDLLDAKNEADKDNYDQLTHEEVKTYNALYKDNKKEATKYLDSLSSVLERRAQVEKQQNYQKMQEDFYNSLQSWGIAGDVVKSIASVGTSLLSGLSYLEQLGNRLFDNDNENFSWAPAATTGFRQSVSDKIDSPFWNMVYNTAMSGIDSGVSVALAAATGGSSAVVEGMSMGILALSAGAQSYQDSISRGMNENQAFATATMSAVFEAAFEKISIGRLLGESDDIIKVLAKQGIKESTLKTLGKEFLKSAGVNASEETMTEFANIAYDTLANGDFSQYSILVQNYIANGMSEEQAEAQAKLDLAKQIGESALSGALMGVGFTTVNTVRAKSSISKTGKKIAKNGREETLFRAADGIDTLNKSLSEAKEEIRKSRTSKKTYEALGKLSFQTLDTIKNNSAKSVKNAAYNRLKELGLETEKLNRGAGILEKVYRGDKLSVSDNSFISKNYQVSRAYNEMTDAMKNGANASTSSSWYVSAVYDWQERLNTLLLTQKPLPGKAIVEAKELLELAAKRDSIKAQENEIYISLVNQGVNETEASATANIIVQLNNGEEVDNNQIRYLAGHQASREAIKTFGTDASKNEFYNRVNELYPDEPKNANQNNTSGQKTLDGESKKNEVKSQKKGAEPQGIDQLHKGLDDINDSTSNLNISQNSENNNKNENTNSSDEIQKDLYAHAESFWEAHNENEKHKEKRMELRDKIKGLFSKKSDTDVSLSEIRKTIEALFDIPISSGHIRQKDASGIFKVKSEAIRTQVSNAMPTISHEFGHFLDKKYGLQNLSQISEAMRVLKEDSSGFYYAYKANERPGESVAEFVRIYLTDRKMAEIKYPEFYHAFRDSLSDSDLKKVDLVGDMINGYMVKEGSEQAKLAIVNQKKEKKIQGIGDRISEAAKEAENLMVDDLVYLKAFGGDAYNLAMIARKSNSQADASVRGAYMADFDGAPVIRRDKDGKIMTDENGNPVLMPSLVRVLEPVAGKKTSEDFSLYLVCKHGLEWLPEDKRVFADDSKNNKEFMESEVKRLEEKYPQFKETSEMLYEWQNVFMKEWLLNTGIISRESYVAMVKKYPHYVPFHRDVESGRNGVKLSYANQSSPIRRAKGSGLEILNPITNIAINVERYIKIANRNAVAQELARIADTEDGFGHLIERVPPSVAGVSVSTESVKKKIMDSIGEMKNVDDATYEDISNLLNDYLGDHLTDFVIKKDQGHNYIWVLENGKRKYYQVHDLKVLEALTAVNPATIGIIQRISMKTVGILKMLTTAKDPTFAFGSNIWRDLDSSYKYSKESNIFRYLKDYASAAIDILRKREDYKLYKTSGGGYNNSFSMNPRTLKRLHRDLSHAERNRIQKILSWVVHPLETIETLTDAVEQAPRLAEYKRVLKSTGNAKTALRAADEITVNFQRHGKLGKEIDAFVPYFNAAIQGTNKLVTEVKNHPIRFGAKSLASALITSAFMFGWNIWMGDEEEYEKLSAYKKNNFFNFSLGDGKFLSIPKSQGTAILNSLVERVVEFAMKDDKDFKREFADFSDYILQTLLPPDPSDIIVLGTIMDLQSNEDFKGTPIVSSQYEDLNAEAQYNESTTWIAKQLSQTWIAKMVGKWINSDGDALSPMQIDYIINSNFGVLGRINRSIGAQEKDYWFGMKTRIFTDNVYSTDTMNRFYDDYEKLEKQVNTYPDDAESVAKLKKYSQTRSIVSELNKYGKEDEEDARLYRRTANAIVEDFMKNASEPDNRLIKLYESTGNKDIFPEKNFKRDYRYNGQSYIMDSSDYLNYIDEYNQMISEAYNETLSLNVSDETMAELLEQAKKEVERELNYKYKYSVENQ